ncbi:MAG TPA: hypothetical protein VLD58_00160 [Gemmatimonadales bacterium]|nr:hypothetical protein [Gemmatimonadales bacterium]
MTVHAPVARATILLLVLSACADAPTPVTVLDQPEFTVDHTFKQVSNVVELTDGRLALAELKDKTFIFVNPASGETSLVGEHSDTIKPNDPAAGKHRLPGYVLHFGGDTVGLVDFGAQRTTLWNEKGEFLSVMPGAGVGGYNQPLAYDAKRNGYKEDYRSVLGGLEPGQELEFDSLSVLRITPGDTVADTVAHLKLPAWGRGQFGEQQKIVSTIFSGRDLFGVLPDGSMWVARASNNAVDWRAPDGSWTRGPSRPFDKIVVPQEEKDAFLEKLRVQMAGMGAPAGIELSYPFADEKPPFGAGLTNPAGEVWLQRSRAWADSVPVWDVVGKDGKQVRTVQLPRNASLAGFGPGGKVYVVLREGEERQKIARYVVK